MPHARQYAYKYTIYIGRCEKNTDYMKEKIKTQTTINCTDLIETSEIIEVIMEVLETHFEKPPGFNIDPMAFYYKYDNKWYYEPSVRIWFIQAHNNRTINTFERKLLNVLEEIRRKLKQYSIILEKTPVTATIITEGNPYEDIQSYFKSH